MTLDPGLQQPPTFTHRRYRRYLCEHESIQATIERECSRMEAEGFTDIDYAVTRFKHDAEVEVSGAEPRGS